MIFSLLKSIAGRMSLI